jgi:hypothetical protein
MAYIASIIRDAENEALVLQRLLEDGSGDPDPTHPIVRLRMSELDAIIAATGFPAGTVLDIKFREWDVCDGNYAVFLSSQPYAKTS